jgi:hypothetical protein
MLTITTQVQSILAALLMSAAAAAQTHIPATGLCNTGLTPASPLPKGCITSALVTPVNPESGGPSVDGNWQLATPYPSAAYNVPPPNPCTLPAFGPAWVDAPWPGWFNPDDGLSQWITPEVEGPVAASGWYIYRTSLPVPPVGAGHSAYVLTVAGQLSVDNDSPIIAMESPAGSPLTCRPVSDANLVGFSAWLPFSFATPVVPDTRAYLYFVTWNGTGDVGNPTGLRVEFTSAYFTPD